MSNLKDFHDIQRLISRFEIELTAIRNRNFSLKIFINIFNFTEIYQNRLRITIKDDNKGFFVTNIEVHNGDVGV